jgi:hypothetical protein
MKNINSIFFLITATLPCVPPHVHHKETRKEIDALARRKARARDRERQFKQFSSNNENVVLSGGRNWEMERRERERILAIV